MQFLNKTLYTALLTFLWLLPVNAYAQVCTALDPTCPNGMYCSVAGQQVGNCVAKRADGTPCDGSFQCASDSCAASPSGTFTCGGVNPPGAGGGLGAPCNGSPDCANGVQCINGACGGLNLPCGSACTLDGDCAAKYCESGTCAPQGGWANNNYSCNNTGGPGCDYTNAGSSCSPNIYNPNKNGTCQFTDGGTTGYECVPEMSDYLAVAFVIVTGGAVYYMRRKKRSHHKA